MGNLLIVWFYVDLCSQCFSRTVGCFTAVKQTLAWTKQVLITSRVKNHPLLHSEKKLKCSYFDIKPLHCCSKLMAAKWKLLKLRLSWSFCCTYTALVSYKSEIQLHKHMNNDQRLPVAGIWSVIEHSGCVFYLKIAFGTREMCCISQIMCVQLLEVKLVWIFVFIQ